MKTHYDYEIRKAPIVRTLIFWENLDRVSPIYWTFVFSVFCGIFSSLIWGRNIILWLGTGMVLFYLIPVAVFVWKKLK
ncbi:MAG: hypothetical protein KC506_00445 [Nanoarchaeota archaeon]|nr:hypothetical protein [Nanoarchaeota archaeon]